MSQTTESGGITAGQALGNTNPGVDSALSVAGRLHDQNGPQAESVIPQQPLAVLDVSNPTVEQPPVITNV